MQRIRIFYAKGAELQYTGNLDMQKVWERTFRRAKLPLAYSQGFHPQPKVQQAAPLPLGFTSQAEILDVWLSRDDSIDLITRSLVSTVQPGIVIQRILPIPLSDEALPNRVVAAEYHCALDGEADPQSIEAGIQKVLSASSILRERRGKGYDLRPLVRSLSLDTSKGPVIIMELSSLPSATGRPEEVLDEIGLDANDADIERAKLVLK